MSEVISFVSREEQLTHTIAQQVVRAREASPLALPAPGDPIVQSYVQKIEGNYDTGRAKKDTDHAIDLLYIAYNATPQAQGVIRKAISKVMDKLIDAQQDSERTIADAVRVAEQIHTALSDKLPDWLDIKEAGQQDEIKTFVSQDLLALARLIEQKAMAVKEQLQVVAERYDEIIADTGKASADSELVLSEVIQNNVTLRAEIDRNKARSAELETLVQSMAAQIASFHAQAADYQARAESAESKSFWASLVQTVMQVTAVVMPIVALASGVGAPAVVGGIVAGSVSRKVVGDTQSRDAIAAREQQVKLSSSRDQLQSSIDAKTQQLEALGNQRQQLDPGNSEALQEMDARIERLGSALRGEQDRHTSTLADLQEIEGLIALLEQKSGGISEAQQSAATSLRALQMEMFAKIEEYESKRGEQESELAKVRVLIAGERSEAESNELAIRSLNLSVSAMKRTKEIVEEVAFFFLSFSSFMRVIADEAQTRIGEYEQVNANTLLRTHRLTRLSQATDEFFIEQAGQWLAVGKVSAIFADTFKDGWSKLNQLNGNYITGDALQQYLGEAALKLDEIAAARKADKAQRISDLNGYREKLQAEIG